MQVGRLGRTYFPFGRPFALARWRGRFGLDFDRAFTSFDGGGVPRYLSDRGIAQLAPDQYFVHARRQALLGELGERPAAPALLFASRPGPAKVASRCASPTSVLRPGTWLT